MLLKCRIICGSEVGKEEAVVAQLLSLHMLGVTENKPEITVRISGVRAEIRTGYIQITIHHPTSLLGNLVFCNCGY